MAHFGPEMHMYRYVFLGTGKPMVAFFKVKHNKKLSDCPPVYKKYDINIKFKCLGSIPPYYSQYIGPIHQDTVLQGSSF